MIEIDKSISIQAYEQFLGEIVNLVQNHQVRAVQTVQTISNQLYWNIGELIIEKQSIYGWGKSIVERLSSDLKHLLGEGISWSPRNLWYMRQLVSEYSFLKQVALELEAVNDVESEILVVNQVGSELETEINVDMEILILNQAGSEFEKVKKLVLEVPWRHNILIIQKVKDIDARIFYLQATVKNRYSRSVLLHQIEADAYGNYLLNPTQHNFALALPEHLLEQTKESIKSVYTLDFFGYKSTNDGKTIRNYYGRKSKTLDDGIRLWVLLRW